MIYFTKLKYYPYGTGPEWNYEKLTTKAGWDHIMNDLSGKKDGDNKLHFNLFYRF